ncbi:hypothetical protein CANMA_002033 [Candida margitis]|uniref:uncharacterized protein n=1 Tax=Candida margitis TaxID=1775924 RepID=UPI002226C43D|nr:uncharacterized protein CANMA_002033 [Candida margitis]KAI5968859.1 hypothetical protein CANMA_002033 [Candida margitis]
MEDQPFIIDPSKNQPPHWPPKAEVDFVSEIDVDKISDTEYRGKVPLKKPLAIRHGVYGGALCSQAILVAMRSVPSDFKPHALHSFFTKGVKEDSVIEWRVQKISNGKSFANRMVLGCQEDQVVFTANISLTTRNVTRPRSDGLVPFSHQIDPPPELLHYDISKLKGIANPNLHTTLRETPKPKVEGVYPYLIKYGIPECETLLSIPEEYKYSLLTWVTDWSFLSRAFAVVLGKRVDADFDVSLDHTIYFHDDDFDATKWVGISLRPTRSEHGRTLMICDLYNDKGKQVATIIQERLYLVKPTAKL